MATRTRFFLEDTIEFDAKAARKHLRAETREPLHALHGALGEVDEWSDAHIEAAIVRVLAARELALGKLAQPLRVAVTGSAASPGIYETLAVLGKDRTLTRIAAAVAHIDAQA